MTSSSPVVRTCVGCGQRELQGAMLRLQIDPAGELTVVAAPQRGRSAYLHARRRCVSGLLRSKALLRSLRTTVERPMRQRITDDLLKFVADDSSEDVPTVCAHGNRVRRPQTAG